MGSLWRFLCALRGHEEYLHFAGNRVYLQCVACGYESPGWTIGSRKPVLKFHARSASHATAKPLDRKIA